MEELIKNTVDRLVALNEFVDAVEPHLLDRFEDVAEGDGDVVFPTMIWLFYNAVLFEHPELQPMSGMLREFVDVRRETDVEGATVWIVTATATRGTDVLRQLRLEPDGLRLEVRMGQPQQREGRFTVGFYRGTDLLRGGEMTYRSMDSSDPSSGPEVAPDMFERGLERLTRASRHIQHLYESSLVAIVTTLEWCFSSLFSQYFPGFRRRLESKIVRSAFAT